MYSGIPHSYKPNPVPAKDRAGTSTRAPWLGELEYRVLSAVLELGLRVFRISDIASRLGKDRRRIHDALSRLVKRGIVRKEARGLYRVSDPEAVASLLGIAQVRNTNGGGAKDNNGTREPRGVSRVASRGCGAGVFLDNVRGYTVSGYVRGDRGRVLSFGDLVNFDRVSYCEFTVETGTRLMVNKGQVVVYYNEGRGSDRVEWRPPKNFIKKFGVATGRRELVGVLLRALAVLLRAVSVVLGRAPVGRLLRVLRSHPGGRAVLVSLQEVLGCDSCPVLR